MNAFQDKIDEALSILAQAKKEGLTLRKLSALGKRTTIAYGTLKPFARGTYRGSMPNIAQLVIDQVVPLLKPPRVTRPPQLKDIAPTLHAQLKPKVRLWGPLIVGRWYNVEAAQLSRLMRGQAKEGVQAFIATVERIGIPDAPTCKCCGGAL